MDSDISDSKNHRKMKKIARFYSFFKAIVFLLLFVIPAHQAAQERINLAGGFGFPELLNLGIRFQAAEQEQFGVSVGAMPSVNNESIFSISGDLFFHFAGSSRFAVRKPWYGRAGLAYTREKTEGEKDTYIFANFRIGRDLNLDERLGVGIDLGAFVTLSKQEETSYSPFLDYEPNEGMVLPGLSIVLFYRL